MAYSERFELLTPSDRKELRKNIVGVAIFSVFAGGVFFVIFYNMGSNGDDIFTYILGGFGLFFLGIIGYIAGTAILDLRDGKKSIISGNVTSKERYKRRSSGKSKNSTPRYYLFFEDKKIEVQHKHFNDVAVGDEVELHYAKWSKKSLDIVQLKTSNSTSISQESQSPKSIKDRMEEWKSERDSIVKKEYPISQNDLKILKKRRNGKLISNIFILVFFTIMTLGFAIGALVDWVFIIPEIIFLIIIFFSFKWIIRCFSKYSRDKKEGIKIATIDTVKDKQVNNGRGKNYNISTLSGSFPVTEVAYGDIQVGDTLYAFYGKHSNWLIGFHTDKTGYIAE